MISRFVISAIIIYTSITTPIVASIFAEKGNSSRLSKYGKMMHDQTSYKSE
jgi:hypothetical protein